MKLWMLATPPLRTDSLGGVFLRYPDATQKALAKMAASNQGKAARAQGCNRLFDRSYHYSSPAPAVGRPSPGFTSATGYRTRLNVGKELMQVASSIRSPEIISSTHSTINEPLVGVPIVY